MTVSPTSVVAGSSGNTLAFTFTGPAGLAFGAGSFINLIVPVRLDGADRASNISVPTLSGTSCNPCPRDDQRAAGRTPSWSTQTCANGDSFTVTYSSAVAPVGHRHGDLHHGFAPGLGGLRRHSYGGPARP